MSFPYELPWLARPSLSQHTCQAYQTVVSCLCHVRNRLRAETRCSRGPACASISNDQPHCCISIGQPSRPNACNSNPPVASCPSRLVFLLSGLCYELRRAWLCRSYLGRAFELSRVFLHTWSVNFKFLPEAVFQGRWLAAALLGAHVLTLWLFAR